MRTGRANEHDDRRDERADVMATDDIRMTAQMKPKMCVPRHRNRTGTGRKSRRLSWKGRCPKDLLTRNRIFCHIVCSSKCRRARLCWRRTPLCHSHSSLLEHLWNGERSDVRSRSERPSILQGRPSSSWDRRLRPVWSGRSVSFGSRPKTRTSCTPAAGSFRCRCKTFEEIRRPSRINSFIRTPSFWS